jgi:hypothetical protein
MVTNTDLSEMINGVWRIKWWKHRYVLIAALIVSLLLINHFFFDQTATDLNPFRTPPTTEGDPEVKGIPPAFPEALIRSSTALSSTSEAASTPATSSAISEPTNTSGPSATIPSSSSTFNLHDYDFDGEYIGWPLERLCKETTWAPGLTFVCDNNSGGIGNIRNFILTCVRYAIDAGASQIILPRIQQRSEDDLANIFTTGFQPFDYFFDEDHFRNTIGTHCPQMKIYNTTEDIPHAEDRLKIKEFYPKDLGDLDGCDGRGVNRHLDMFRPKFDNWLNTTQQTPNATHPVTIRFKWATFFEWPIYRDGPEFAATFGDILRLRKDIQALAAKALTEMSSFVGVKPNGKTLEAPYLGVHLRTESDALGFWPNFNEQSNGYLAQADKRGIKHAYLACGNATEGKRFADKAWEKSKLNVTTKLDLLRGEDLKQLTDLSWDQQALVDFLILSKSTHFTGCSFSSFTMNIAFKRHLMTGGIQTRPWKSPGDEFSTLIGRFESWYGDWMFMYECMWP